MVMMRKQFGAVQECYTYTAAGKSDIYDPTGTTLRSTSSIGNPYMFTSRRWDAKTGNYYFRARFQRPSIAGQFLNRDPLEYPDGYSMYNGYFVQGMGADPMGLAANNIVKRDATVDGKDVSVTFDCCTKLEIDALIAAYETAYKVSVPVAADVAELVSATEAIVSEKYTGIARTHMMVWYRISEPNAKPSLVPINTAKKGKKISSPLVYWFAKPQWDFLRLHEANTLSKNFKEISEHFKKSPTMKCRKETPFDSIAFEGPFDNSIIFSKNKYFGLGKRRQADIMYHEIVHNALGILGDIGGYHWDPVPAPAGPNFRLWPGGWAPDLAQTFLTRLATPDYYSSLVEHNYLK